MNNLDQSINFPTLTGLRSLELDELSTQTLNSDTIDGNIIYYNTIEGNNIIVDTTLSLTNTGVISVGGYTISDIELTYLDGVTSNIQQQFQNINLTSSGLISTVNLHTSQIYGLQLTDLSHNLLLNQHTTDINNLNYAVSGQATTLSTHTTDINNLNYAVNGQATTLTTHTGQITTLQTQVSNLQNSDSTQATQITNLQNSDVTQNTNITNLQNTTSTQATQISTLQSKTQNISSADTTATNMSKKIVITNNSECLKMIGDHTYITGFDVTDNTRDFYIGTPGAGLKNLNIVNEKAGELTLYGGKDGTGNIGRQKINLFSNGVQLYRGGPTTWIGDIGGSNTSNTDFIIKSNGSNNIFIGAGSGTITLNTSSTITANTNMFYIGSGSANANGFYSNIRMLDGTGNNWETQSRAFTETLRASVFTSEATVTTHNAKFNDASSFGGGTGRIKLTKNFELMGRPNGTTTLVNSTTYVGSTTYNIGSALSSSYPSLFLANGSFLASSMNFDLRFEMEFGCKNSSLKSMRSYIVVKNSVGAWLENSRTNGVLYRTAQTFHEYVLYNVCVKRIMNTGDYLYLVTDHDFVTGTEGTLTSMTGVFTIERSVL